jgi:hypothetical protein
VALNARTAGIGHNQGPQLDDEVAINDTLSMTLATACRATKRGDLR